MQRLGPFASALWCVALVAFPLASLGWLPFEASVALFTLSGIGAAVLAVLTLQRHGPRAVLRGPGLAGIGLALLVVSVAAWSIASFPWLNDVATTKDAPPRFHGPAGDGSNSTAMVARTSLGEAPPATVPSLGPVKSSAKPPVLMGRAMIAARSLPNWQTHVFDLKGGYLEGETRSRWLGIPSVIAVQVRREEQQSILDVRARSPIATGDFGSNVRLIELFFKRLGEASICRPSADFRAGR